MHFLPLSSGYSRLEKKMHYVHRFKKTTDAATSVNLFVFLAISVTCSFRSFRTYRRVKMSKPIISIEPARELCALTDRRRA